MDAGYYADPRNPILDAHQEDENKLNFLPRGMKVSI